MGEHDEKVSVVLDNLERRVTGLEDKVSRIDDKLVTETLNKVELQQDIKHLKDEFANLKADVLSSIKGYTDNTWKLMDKQWKVIIMLIIVLIALVGVRFGPEIIKMFMGGM